MVFDSFGGFRLDDGSVLSPDASVPCAVRWHAYMANGARLGWLLTRPSRLVKTVCTISCWGLNRFDTEGMT
jgi:hypothetical protein